MNVILSRSAAAAALSAVLLYSGCKGADNVPPFSIPENTDASSAAVGTPKESAATADVEADEPAEQLPCLLTSYDPRHFFRIEFGEGSLEVCGVYDGAVAQRVYLTDEVKYPAVPEYEGDTFCAVLDYGELSVADGLVELFIEGNELSESFWVAVKDGSVLPADTESFIEATEKAVSAPRELPAEGTQTYIDHKRDTERMKSVLEQVRSISDEVCAGLSDDYEKFHALSRWVSANIAYDYDARENVTDETLCLSHVLEKHRTVCGGYANLLAALCAAQNIPCTLVRGEASPGECFADPLSKGAYHEWLFAEINGRRVWADAVWNSANYYARGEYYMYESNCEKYFDITPEALSQDHIAHFSETRDYFSAVAASD